MMSLFSSFDLGIFFSTFILFFLFFFLGLNHNFYFIISNSYIKAFITFITEFFNSLNNSNFTKSFFSFIFMLMIFIFLINSSSIFPFIFPLSSQMSLILGISLFSWISIITISFFKNFKSQLSHFIPEGSPLGLSFILMLIEIVSSMIRPLTLSVRLVANILAGHLLVILLCLLVSNFPAAFPFLTVLNLIELFVSFIQSYIFVTLMSLYFSEV